MVAVFLHQILHCTSRLRAKLHNIPPVRWAPVLISAWKSSETLKSNRTGLDRRPNHSMPAHRDTSHFLADPVYQVRQITSHLMRRAVLLNLAARARLDSLASSSVLRPNTCITTWPASGLDHMSSHGNQNWLVRNTTCHQRAPMANRLAAPVFSPSPSTRGKRRRARTWLPCFETPAPRRRAGIILDLQNEKDARTRSASRSWAPSERVPQQRPRRQRTCRAMPRQ